MEFCSFEMQVCLLSVHSRSFEKHFVAANSDHNVCLQLLGLEKQTLTIFICKSLIHSKSWAPGHHFWKLFLSRGYGQHCTFEGMQTFWHSKLQRCNLFPGSRGPLFWTQAAWHSDTKEKVRNCLGPKNGICPLNIIKLLHLPDYSGYTQNPKQNAIKIGNIKNNPMQSLDVEFQHLDTTPIACSHLGPGTMLQISPNHWKHMKTYHTIVCRETLTNNMSSRPNKFFPIILRNSSSSLLETLYQTVRCWFSVDTEYFWRSSSSSGVGLRYVPGQWSYWSLPSFTFFCYGLRGAPAQEFRRRR